MCLDQGHKTRTAHISTCLDGNAKSKAGADESRQTGSKLSSQANQKSKVDKRESASRAETDADEQVDDDSDAGCQGHDHRGKDIDAHSNSKMSRNLEQHCGAEVDNGNNNCDARLDISDNETARRHLGSKIDAQLDNQINNDLKIHHNVGGKVDVNFDGGINLGVYSK